MRAILLLLTFAGWALADGVTIPVVGQPDKHFYGAAGRGVTLTATVEPAAFSRNESCILTLRVTKLLNAPALRQPKLDEIEAFQRDFQVDELPDGPAKANERVFRYRLRPRSTDVTEIPEITYRYFDPNVISDVPAQRFRTTRSEAIPITVTKPADPPVLPPVPLDIPAFAESLDDTPAPWATPGTVLQVLGLMFVLFGLAAAWLRWRDEDSEGFQRRQRNRLARRTLRLLGRERLPLDELMRVMRDYHKARSGTSSRADEWTAFLARVDEFRFAPGGSRSVNDLRMAALDLVRRREDEG